MTSTMERLHSTNHTWHPLTHSPRFGKILVATDFSPQAQTALRIAASLARQFHSSLLLVHAVPPILYGAGLEACTSVVLDANLDGGLAKMEDEIAACKALRGLEHKTVVANGSLIDLIHDLVAKEKVSLVVCGSHGAHGIEKLVLGSTAESIVNHVQCPVLVVGPECIPRGLPCERILFPTDLASGSHRSAEYAASLAEEMKAQLTFLHVAPAPIPQHSYQHGDEREQDHLHARLRELLPRQMDNLCHMKTRIRFGEAGRQICAEAEEDRSGLIVMSIREHGPLADHAFWSTLAKTIQKAPCPVLALRQCLLQ